MSASCIKIPQVLVIGVLLVVTGCGSRYDRMNCPGNPFPESVELLNLTPFKRFLYFKGNSNDRSDLDSEIWADQKFEFTASLQYHYSKQEPRSADCPCAVTLLLSHPLSKEREELGWSFLGFFETLLGGRSTAVRTAYSEGLRIAEPGFLKQVTIGELVAEVSSFRQVARGTFLQIGFYLQDYYSSRFRPPGFAENGPD